MRQAMTSSGLVQRVSSQREPKVGPPSVTRCDDDRGGEQAHQDAGVEQHVAGAGIVDGAELELEPGPDHEDAEREPDQPAPQFGIVEAEFDVGVDRSSTIFSLSFPGR